eukprot:snap_masked-scaffold_42-processed-gene-1.16-mRNA-1 protein AED:1.00 eAED:1.00 QI:0/0/0/0/1/1/2/0/319
MQTEKVGENLFVLFDGNAQEWESFGKRSGVEFGFTDIIDVTMITLSVNNKVTVAAYNFNKEGSVTSLDTGTIYPDFMFLYSWLAEYEKGSGKSSNILKYQRVETKFKRKVNRLIKFLSKEGVSDDGRHKNSLARALSLAICYLGRLRREEEKVIFKKHLLKPLRIVLFTASPESSLGKFGYLPCLNAAFSASKLKIPINIVDFSIKMKENVLYKQIASNSEGNIIQAANLEPFSKKKLISLLWSAFSAKSELRNLMNTPKTILKDFEYSELGRCFCHSELIDLGGTCSGCFAIYCEKTVQKVKESRLPCPTCKSQLRFH